MSQTGSPHVQICRNCGRLTVAAGHLCSPQPVAGIAYCSYCGAVAQEMRHLCAPKVLQLKYYCRTCGRAATHMEFLCNPMSIPNARAEVLPPEQQVAPAPRGIAKPAPVKKAAGKVKTGSQRIGKKSPPPKRAAKPAARKAKKPSRNK